MINWETLQFQATQMPVGDKKVAICGLIFGFVFVLFGFLGLYLDYLNSCGEKKIDKKFLTLAISIILICSFAYAHVRLQKPYYKISVEVEKPIGFENKLSKIEKDRKYFKLLGRLSGQYVVILHDKDHYFCPYLDCVVDNNALKVGAIISKKKFESFKTKEDFRRVFKHNVLKQVEFVKNYKSMDEIKKEKEEFVELSKEVETSKGYKN